MADKIKRIYLGDKMLPRIYQSNVVGSVYSGDFEPTDITGLSLWLDASNTDSITLNNGNVSEWSDLSNNNRNFTQSSANAQPLYAELAMNDLAVVRANGTDHWIVNTGPDLEAESFSMFLVSRHLDWILDISKPANIFHTDFPLSGNSSFGLRSEQYNNDEVVRFGDSDSNQALSFGSTQANTLNVSRIMEYSFERSTRLAEVRKNGIIGNSATVNASNVPEKFGSNFALFTGFQDASLRRVNAEIAELVFFSRTVTTAERQKIEGYLAWKWGLQEQLPYDHPYASSFPGFGSQTLPTDSDAVSYLSALSSADGTGVEVGVAKVIEDFIVGCKSDGIWDSIKASCILAGARTLNGALVPLAPPLGSELWSVSTPSIVNFGGSIGVWDGSTRTMSNSVIGSNVSYPRFQFSLPLTIGKRYAVSGTLTGDTSAINTIRLSSLPGASNVSYNSATGAFYATNVPAAAALLEFTTNGTLAFSVSIADLSIRETSGPTNNNFVTADYDRKTGLKGNGSNKSLNTNRPANADDQNYRHVSVWISEAATGSNDVYLGTVATNPTNIQRLSPTVTSFAVSGGTYRIRTTDVPGFVAAKRENANKIITWMSGSGQEEDSISGPSTSQNLYILDRSVGSLASDGRVAFYSIGEALDLEKLDNRVSRFMAENKFFLNTGLSGKDYDIDTLNYINAGYENGGSIG